MKNRFALPALCLACATAALVWCGCASSDVSLKGAPEPVIPPAVEPTGFLVRTNYRGWADSIWMSNGKVEAIIVPAIGRIMQFRLQGQEDGPFWENPQWLGQAPDPQSKEWRNFGGDKVWPAPQKSWGDVTPTNWPPPAGFDASPVTASVHGWVVTLTSPVAPHYGIRTVRTIELLPGRSTMQIITVLEKLEGDTLDVAPWVVTQLKDPVAMYTPLPMVSSYPQGFNLMSLRRPPSLTVRKGLLSLQRDPKESYKIGLDTGTLLWIGEHYMLRIDSARRPFMDYPDDGASAQVYTNPDPAPYVEFEMFAPLKQMRRGHQAVALSSYTLLPRLELDPVLEARRELKRW